MTVRNNAVIAYVKCRDCDERASLHMIMRGKARLGDLYTRNCKCGCNQSGDSSDQVYWRKNAEPVDGWKDLVHPDFKNIFDQVETDQVDQVETIEPETGDSDQVETDQVETNQGGAGKALGFLGLLVVGGLAVMGFRR